MGSFLWFVLVVVLIIYAAYFAFINTAAAFFDSQTKMVTLYLWRNLTFLSRWDLQTLAISVRLWELVLYGTGGACHLRLDHRVVDGTERRSGTIANAEPNPNRTSTDQTATCPLARATD
jgi:hypothetical protein